MRGFIRALFFAGKKYLMRHSWPDGFLAMNAKVFAKNAKDSEQERPRWKCEAIRA